MLNGDRDRYLVATKKLAHDFLKQFIVALFGVNFVF